MKVCARCLVHFPDREFVPPRGRPRLTCIACSDIGEPEARAKREHAWAAGAELLSETIRAWCPTATEAAHGVV